MSDDLTLRVAALKVVSDFTAEQYKEAREEIARRMSKGDRLTARSPLGDAKLGTITMSDPKTTARIADEAAFGAWAAKHYPDRIEWDMKVIGSHEQVVSVLYEHANHLVKRVTKVDPDLVREVREASAHFGEPAGPDGQVDVPGVAVETAAGVVSCRLNDNALAEVIELFRTERMTLESMALPENPEGAA